jgi:3-vinyl bacteriochlorophyllide hydratase
VFLTHRIIDKFIDSVDACPWPTLACRLSNEHVYTSRMKSNPLPSKALYTPEQRRRRDETVWTLVQGILAPVQFVVFLVSLTLVVNFLLTGEGEGAATASIVAKTLVLYTIMITGAIWENEVYGQYLFAPAFFWEDTVSFLVLALHTAYLYALMTGALSVEAQMYLALAAYLTYVVNAAQFLLKLRAARLQTSGQSSGQSIGTAA